MSTVKNKLNTLQTVTSKNGTVSGGYVRIGRLVIVDINYTNSVALQKSTTEIIEGIPSSLNNYATLLALDVSISTAYTAFTIRNRIRPLFDLSSTGHQIRITGAYITADESI